MAALFAGHKFFKEVRADGDVNCLEVAGINLGVKDALIHQAEIPGEIPFPCMFHLNIQLTVQHAQKLIKLMTMQFHRSHSRECDLCCLMGRYENALVFAACIFC